MKEKVVLFWFRRDLRLQDNVGLFHALNSGEKVVLLFIFDTNILSELEDKNDARIHFIHQSLIELNTLLKQYNSSVLVKYGEPTHVWQTLLTDYDIQAIYTNRSYELYDKMRDHSIAEWAKTNGILFYTYKDIVIYEGHEVVKADGNPYAVFTPYYNKWMSRFQTENLAPIKSESLLQNLKSANFSLPSLQEIGFEPSNCLFPSKNIDALIMLNYDETRDIPSLENGTSHLGLHLRFGTIGIRQLVMEAQKHNAIFLKELVWREFYQMLLVCYPQINGNQSFNANYDKIEWRNNPVEFELWTKGLTGFPLVDAGMRQLTATGYMHNRVRMIVASFLTKNLLIDWRRGEAWFARYLLDYDFAANNGGWQWAAGCGCDAAPYFRIFNPITQLKKFDPDLKYVKKWIPEFETLAYPNPIIDLKESRSRCLAVYQKALTKQ